MMAVFISEYVGAGYVSANVRDNSLPQEPATQTTVFSSGGTASSANLAANTRLVRIIADSNAWALFSNSTASTAAVTSTNSGKIIAGTGPEFRAVVPGSRYSILST
jgi:hypothetical protein